MELLVDEAHGGLAILLGDDERDVQLARALRDRDDVHARLPERAEDARGDTGRAAHPLRRAASAPAGRRLPRGRVPPLAGGPETDRPGGGAGADVSTTETLATPPPAKPAVEPLVRLEGVKKHFPITRGIIFQRKVGAVHAVDGVDLEIFPGETLGLVGETGCGKSTLARVLMRLYGATAGTIWFDGRDVTNLKGKQLRE